MSSTPTNSSMISRVFGFFTGSGSKRSRTKNDGGDKLEIETPSKRIKRTTAMQQEEQHADIQQKLSFVTPTKSTKKAAAAATATATGGTAATAITIDDEEQPATSSSCGEEATNACETVVNGTVAATASGDAEDETSVDDGAVADSFVDEPSGDESENDEPALRDRFVNEPPSPFVGLPQQRKANAEENDSTVEEAVVDEKEEEEEEAVNETEEEKESIYFDCDNDNDDDTKAPSEEPAEEPSAANGDNAMMPPPEELPSSAGEAVESEELSSSSDPAAASAKPPPQKPPPTTTTGESFDEEPAAAPEASTTPIAGPPNAARNEPPPIVFQPILPPPPPLPGFEYVEFLPVDKQQLDYGNLSYQIGGMLDRSSSLDQFYSALEKLAGQTGVQNFTPAAKGEPCRQQEAQTIKTEEEAEENTDAEKDAEQQQVPNLKQAAAATAAPATTITITTEDTEAGDEADRELEGAEKEEQVPEIDYPDCESEGMETEDHEDKGLEKDQTMETEDNTAREDPNNEQPMENEANDASTEQETGTDAASARELDREQPMESESQETDEQQLKETEDEKVTEVEEKQEIETDYEVTVCESPEPDKDELMELNDLEAQAELDKQQVPLIGITGNPGSGKTEFLRWIFNNCCTFQGKKPSKTAKKLVQRLNEALPDDQEPFENLLVLYASFGGTSAYTVEEGPIAGNTVERLLRSFHGNLVFRDEHPRPNSKKQPRRYEGLDRGQSIIDLFTEVHGRTGFVFLLDDLSELKYKHQSDYKELMDSVLQFSQKCLKRGIFCAVAGSARTEDDLCEVVVTECGRAVEPITFPGEMPELEAKTRELLSEHSDIHAESFGLSLAISMKVLQSSTSVRCWEEYVCGSLATRDNYEPLSRRYWIPTTDDGVSQVSPGYVFLLASRTVLGAGAVEDLDKTTVHAIVERLCGHLALETDDKGRITNWDKPRGTLSVPGWRLFQFRPTFHEQLFPQIQNWVLVETKKMIYDYGPSQATKSLETSTMAMLELRKAMIQAVNGGTPPTLGELYQGISVHHNLSEKSLGATASKHPASLNYFRALPHDLEVIDEPNLYLSNVDGEKGIEGVFRHCFEDNTNKNKTTTIFFQTKLYTAVGPEELCDWIVGAHKRARELGYRKGEYIVQLFVPGDFASGKDDEDDETVLFKGWPENSMVFSDSALVDLFDPFLSLKALLIE